VRISHQTRTWFKGAHLPASHIDFLAQGGYVLLPRLDATPAPELTQILRSTDKAAERELELE
jgi:hypothetical protein